MASVSLQFSNGGNSRRRQFPTEAGGGRCSLGERCNLLIGRRQFLHQLESEDPKCGAASGRPNCACLRNPDNRRNGLDEGLRPGSSQLPLDTAIHLAARPGTPAEGSMSAKGQTVALPSRLLARESSASGPSPCRPFFQALNKNMKATSSSSNDLRF